MVLGCDRVRLPLGTASPLSRLDAEPLTSNGIGRSFAPAQSAAIDVAYKSALSSIAEGPPKTNGVKFGQMVAEKLLELRGIDGSAQKADIRLKDGPGLYQLTPPHSMQPILAHWGAVRPFVIRLDGSYTTKLPPGLDNAKFKADFDEVKLLGARHSSARTADQTAAAVFWTVQTGVPWFAAARAAATERKAALLDNLHLFAVLSVAAADSQIACFKDKYDRLHWRPITATVLPPPVRSRRSWEMPHGNHSLARLRTPNIHRRTRVFPEPPRLCCVASCRRQRARERHVSAGVWRDAHVQ